MKVLVVGSGGREHALAWKLSRSKVIEQILTWPGSPTLSSCAKRLELPCGSTYEALVEKIKALGISFVVVGPEKPLAEGFADLCVANKIPVFGPNKSAALLEASKSFAKKVMKSAGIPTARFEVVASEESCRKEAIDMLDRSGGTVIKASGLAGGKGVFVCHNESEVSLAIERLYRSSMVEACQEVVVEEVLKGRECSFFAFVGEDGATPLGFAVDFKRLEEGDRGPNTGGMGCYAPAPWLPHDAEDQVMSRIVTPLLNEMESRGAAYTGCLYVGIMWGKEGPSVVEFNVRLGDPEAQVLAVQDQRDWGELIAQHLGICAKFDFGPPDVKSKSVCIVLASGSYPYGDKEESYPLLPAAMFENLNDDLCVFGASIESSPGEQLRAGKGRVLSVVARGSTIKDARKLAYQEVQNVASDWEDVQFRRDIGQRAEKEEMDS